MVFVLAVLFLFLLIVVAVVVEVMIIVLSPISDGIAQTYDQRFATHNSFSHQGLHSPMFRLLKVVGCD